MDLDIDVQMEKDKMDYLDLDLEIQPVKTTNSIDDLDLDVPPAPVNKPVDDNFDMDFEELLAVIPKNQLQEANTAVVIDDLDFLPSLPKPIAKVAEDHFDPSVSNSGEFDKKSLGIDDQRAKEAETIKTRRTLFIKKFKELQEERAGKSLNIQSSVAGVEKMGGYLMKHKPVWPHNQQRRYVELSSKGCKYFDSEGGRHKGSIDLNNAKIKTCTKTAFTFLVTAMNVARQGSNADSDEAPSKTSTFTAADREEFDDWLSSFQNAIKFCTYRASIEKMHWFEKLYIGIY